MLTGIPNAFSQLCEAIPKATSDYLASIAADSSTRANQTSVYSQLSSNAQNAGKTLLEQIMSDNFSTYNGF